MHQPPPSDRPSGIAGGQPSLRPTPLGAILFALYLILYCTFVFLNAFSPATMEFTPFAGVNLAVLSGLGLIVAAFVLALLYDWLGRREGGQ